MCASDGLQEGIATAIGIRPETLYAAADWFEPESSDEHEVETHNPYRSSPNLPEGGLDRGLPRVPGSGAGEMANRFDLATGRRAIRA
jgi:hypothetical protein